MTRARAFRRTPRFKLVEGKWMFVGHGPVEYLEPEPEPEEPPRFQWDDSAGWVRPPGSDSK